MDMKTPSQNAYPPIKQETASSGKKLKKIVIIAIVILILVLAVLTVLGNINQNKSSSIPSGRQYGGSSAMPSVAPTPSTKSLGVPTSESLSDSAAAPDIASSTIDKKVIKNGNLNLKVNSIDDSSRKISDIAKAGGGDVFSSDIYESDNNLKSGTITVKVPVSNFETVFNQVKSIATLVVQESTSGQDVTEEYTDLQAQLKNKQAEEQQFVQILGQAQKIDDILAVTRELSRVRGEIEQLQGRIKFLSSQSDMASISIYLTEDTNITFSDSWRPWQVVKETFNGLVKGAQGFVNFLIVLIIQVIPILVLYLLIFYIIYRIGRKIYLKVKNK